MESYNNWTMLSERTKGNTKELFRCVCGIEQYVNYSNVKSGKSKGCIECQARATSARLTTHGKSSGSKLYMVWAGIKRRCYNEKQESYKYYGAKGVSMCDEWLNSFQAFEYWAKSNGYKVGMHISRFGDTGNYEPSNCKVSTSTENISEAHKGKEHSNERRLLSSLKKSGLSVDEYTEIVDAMLSGEFKATELEQETGIDRHNLLTMCRLCGSEPNWRKFALDTIQISQVKKYKKDGLTNKDIGVIFNVSHETIRQALKR